MMDAAPPPLVFDEAQSIHPSQQLRKRPRFRQDHGIADAGVSHNRARMVVISGLPAAAIQPASTWH